MHGVGAGIAVEDDIVVGLKQPAPDRAHTDVAIHRKEGGRRVRAGVVGMPAERAGEIHLHGKAGGLAVHREADDLGGMALGAQAVAEQLALRILAAAVQPVDRNQLCFCLFHQFSLSSLLTTISRYCVFEISTSRGFCPSGALTKPRASMMSMIFAARP